MNKCLDSENSDLNYIHRIYQNIIVLAIFTHTFFIFAASLFHFPSLTVYNTFSVIFYIAMIHVSQMNWFRAVVTSIHIEVCLFVCVSAFVMGWDKGFALYLIATSTLVYFCPFKHKYIPYLFSFFEIILFIGLKLYLDISGRPPALLPGNIKIYLYLLNSLACFAIILYAAYLSNLSASVSLQKLEDANEDLTQIANHDALTGLYSRHYVMERVKLYEQMNIQMAIADIDDFKNINDTYGHDTGDYVLRTIADLMKRLAGNDADVCRWGGEEFLLIFHKSSIKEAHDTCRTICDTIASYAFICHGSRVTVTMTIGLCRTQDMDFADKVRRADQCLYEGKTHGKNQVVTCDCGQRLY